MDPLSIAIFGVLFSVVGSAIGAYVAFKVAVAVLEQRMKTAEQEIRGLRDSRHHLSDAVARLQLSDLKRGKV